MIPERDAVLLDLLKRKYADHDTTNFIVSDFLYAFGSPLVAVMYLGLFWPEFVTFDGMVFRDDVLEDDADRQRVRDALAESGGDMTSVEQSFNILDLFESIFSRYDAGPTDFVHKLLLDRLVTLWKLGLAAAFPDREFVVEAIPPEANGGDWAITFYTQRGKAGPRRATRASDAVAMASPDPNPPPLPSPAGAPASRILGLEAWEHLTISGALLGLMSAMTLPWGEWMSWTGGVVGQVTVHATESWDGWVYLLAVAAVAVLTGLTALQRARGDGPQPRTFPLVYALALVAFLASIYFQFFGGPYASSSGGILFLRHEAPHGPYHVDIGWILSLCGTVLTSHGVAWHRRDDRRKRREEAARASVATSGGIAGANP